MIYFNFSSFSDSAGHREGFFMILHFSNATLPSLSLSMCGSFSSDDDEMEICKRIGSWLLGKLFVHCAEFIF